MPNVDQFVINQLLIPATVTFFFIGGLISVAIGVGLICRSPKIFRLFDLTNRYVSTRRATKTMAIPHDSGQFVWKHRLLLGVVFVVGATYSIWGLTVGANDAAITSILALKLPRGFVLWIVESVRYVMIAGSAMSIIVGILMLASPDALKAIESISSRWYSTRRIAPDADEMIMSLDHWVATFPRTAGLLILFPALGIALYFGDLLLKRA